MLHISDLTIYTGFDWLYLRLQGWCVSHPENFTLPGHLFSHSGVPNRMYCLECEMYSRFWYVEWTNGCRWTDDGRLFSYWLRKVQAKEFNGFKNCSNDKLEVFLIWLYYISWILICLDKSRLFVCLLWGI